jgi:hypothetical protein
MKHLSREVIMSQMILEYDEFCMFLLNIDVFNIMTPDFLYTSENETKCTIMILYKKKLNDRVFRYSRILRRIYTFHIQCILKVEDLNALYLEN